MLDDESTRLHPPRTSTSGAGSCSSCGAELFTSNRYEDLSMNRIAAEAGISKALLYHYFPSKQAFFEETLGAWAEQLRERTDTGPGPDRRPSSSPTAWTPSWRWSKRTPPPIAT